MSGIGYKICYQCGAHCSDTMHSCGVCGEDLDMQILIQRLNEEIKRLKEILIKNGIEEV